jgi:hypothetical protein
MRKLEINKKLFVLWIKILKQNVVVDNNRVIHNTMWITLFFSVV